MARSTQPGRRPPARDRHRRHEPRANVDDGKVTKDGDLKFAETDMHKGEKPNVVGGAYINSVKGAKETALYDIDGTIGGLLKQAPPNDGVLSAVGKLGIKADKVAFDIWSDGNGKNDAWLMAGDTLYSAILPAARRPKLQRSAASAEQSATIASCRACKRSSRLPAGGAASSSAAPLAFGLQSRQLSCRGIPVFSTSWRACPGHPRPLCVVRQKNVDAATSGA